MRPYYQDGYVTIYHGDCMEILPKLGKFELLLTDPPYGVTQQKWDNTECVAGVIEYAYLAVFTVGERLLANLIYKLPEKFRHIWIWDRVNRYTDFLNADKRPMRSHELIAVFSEGTNYQFNPLYRLGSYKTRNTKPSNGNGSYGQNKAQPYGKIKKGLHPRSIISFPGCKTNSQMHPTEKPLSLYEYLLRSYPGGMVVDPFAGSGTTGRAAKDLNRRAILIEKEEKYCEIAANRMKQEVLPLWSANSE